MRGSPVTLLPRCLPLLVLLAGAGATLPARAADPQGRPEAPPRTVLTLPEALAFAHAHQPTIRAALARVAAERANARVPRAQWEPLVGATAQILAATPNNTTASYLSIDEVALPRIGGSRDVSSSTANWQPYASTLVAASASQEVFDFGRIAAESAAADARVEIQRLGAEAERLNVDLGVEEAYFGVYAAKGVLAASMDAYTRTKEHRDFARAGVGSGLRSPIELTRAEADLARYEIAVVRAQGELDVARVVLAAALGAPEASFDVTPTAPAPADLPPLAESIRRASERDPRLLEALARLKAQEKDTSAIGARLRPNLFATAAISGRAGGGVPSGNGDVAAGSGFAPDVPNWDLGLVLAWSVFDGVVLARRDASRAAEEARREDVAAYRQGVVALVQQVYVRVATAKSAIPALESAVAGATANYKQADARFRAGLGNAVELADAEQLESGAQIQLALGLFEVARARAAFGRAIAEGL